VCVLCVQAAAYVCLRVCMHVCALLAHTARIEDKLRARIGNL